VAQVTQFKKAKQRMGQDTEEYKKKIKRYRMIRATIIVAIILLIAIIAVLIYIYSKNKRYTDYEVLSAIESENGELVEYKRYADGYLRYNNDGIEYISDKEGSVWKQSYQMRNPQVKICKDYVAVGNVTSNSIYIFDKTGLKNILDTVFPITQVEVAAQGAVVTTLEDETSNYINMYSVKGDMIYSVKTTISGEGYPLDIAISEDAKKMVASYSYMSGASLKSKVVFYNFSEVGKNEVERLVGSFNYEGAIVPNVDFIGNDRVIAFSDNALRIYDIEEYPALNSELTLDEEVKSIVHSDKYIGLLFENANTVDKYTLKVYDFNTKNVLTHTYANDYTTIKFVDEGILLYNDYNCSLINMKGKERFAYKFDLRIQNIINVSENIYYLINSKYIQKIKLK